MRVPAVKQSLRSLHVFAAANGLRVFGMRFIAEQCDDLAGTYFSLASRSDGGLSLDKQVRNRRLASYRWARRA